MQPKYQTVPQMNASRNAATAQIQRQQTDMKKRLEISKEALTYAKLASYAYQHHEPKAEGTQLPAGWKVMSQDELDELGVTSDMLFDDTDRFGWFRPGEKTGHSFAAVVLKFESDKPGESKVVVSFRGTVGAPLRSHNWQTNAREGIGCETTEHTMTMNLAKKLQAGLLGKKYKLSFTGHSLGGGLASAASVVTGLEAFTMDSAPLNANTVARNMKGEGWTIEVAKAKMKEIVAKIHAFHLTTDPLTNAFAPSIGNWISPALGQAHPVQPDTAHRHEAPVFLGQSALGIPKQWHNVTGIVVRPLLALPNLLTAITGLGRSSGGFSFLGGANEAGKRALDGHDHKLLIKALEEDIAHMEKESSRAAFY